MRHRTSKEELDFYAKLGDALRHLRLRQGLSQDHFGQQLGISFQQWQKYEQGINRISLLNLIRALKIFGISLKDLAEILDLDFNGLKKMDVLSRDEQEFLSDYRSWKNKTSELQGMKIAFGYMALKILPTGKDNQKE